MDAAGTQPKANSPPAYAVEGNVGWLHHVEEVLVPTMPLSMMRHRPVSEPLVGELP